MYTIGLTGGIGSGKSTVAGLFEALGIAVIDADVIAHELTAPGEPAVSEIQKTFGNTVVNTRGELDRSAMRRLAFTNMNIKKQLEDILHPMIRREIDRRAAVARSPYIILAVPLLLESAGYRDRVRRIAVVDCTEDQQMERAMARSGLDEQALKAIMHSQVNRTERLAAADDIIDNSRDPAFLLDQVNSLHRKYLGLAAEHLS